MMVCGRPQIAHCALQKDATRTSHQMHLSKPKGQFLMGKTRPLLNRPFWYSRPGVLKLWTSTFLMYFGVLNLDSGNQIWKFKYRYFGKFSEFEFNKYHIFWTLDFYRIKIGLSLKSLGTTELKSVFWKFTLLRRGSI